MPTVAQGRAFAAARKAASSARGVVQRASTPPKPPAPPKPPKAPTYNAPKPPKRPNYGAPTPPKSPYDPRVPRGPWKRPGDTQAPKLPKVPKQPVYKVPKSKTMAEATEGTKKMLKPQMDKLRDEHYGNKPKVEKPKLQTQDIKKPKTMTEATEGAKKQLQPELDRARGKVAGSTPDPVFEVKSAELDVPAKEESESEDPKEKSLTGKVTDMAESVWNSVGDAAEGVAALVANFGQAVMSAPSLVKLTGKLEEKSAEIEKINKQLKQDGLTEERKIELEGRAKSLQQEISQLNEEVKTEAEKVKSAKDAYDDKVDENKADRLFEKIKDGELGPSSEEWKAMYEDGKATPEQVRAWGKWEDKRGDELHQWRGENLKPKSGKEQTVVDQEMVEVPVTNYYNKRIEDKYGTPPKNKAVVKLKPIVADMVNRAKENLAEQGVDLVIMDSFRTTEDQRKAYDADQALPEDKRKGVAHPDYSFHPRGQSIDLPTEMKDDKVFEALEAAGLKQNPVEWWHWSYGEFGSDLTTEQLSDDAKSVFDGETKLHDLNEEQLKRIQPELEAVGYNLEDYPEGW